MIANKVKLCCLVIALAAIAGPAAAQSTWFVASLAGDREVGNPGDGDGWGVAAVGVDGSVARYYIWVTDVDQPSAAHIHSGAAGASGGIAIDFEAVFAEVADNTYVAQGVVTSDASTIAALLASPGAYYFNVHNPDHPSGALRGQVLGDGAAASSLAASLRGFRELDGNGDLDGDGFGVVTLDDKTAFFFFRSDGIASPTAAHIHRGTAMENGQVVVDAAVAFNDGVSMSSVPIDEDLAAEILASPGDFYLNVHNAEFPGGAIRGQLRPTETVVFFPVISRAIGQAGSQWSTALRVVSLGDEQLDAYAEWFPANVAGLAEPAATERVVLPAGEIKVIDDAVSSLFGADGNGALKLSAPEPFRAAARIFNDQRSNPAIGGTFGQAAPAYDASRILSSGLLLLGSNRPSSDGEGFRSNLGYFNPWPETVTVEVDVRDAGGRVLGADTLAMKPLANAIRGVFDLVESVPEQERRIDEMLITFSATRPVLMYLSAVDNVTNDAIFVMPEAAPAISATVANSPPNGTIVSPQSDLTVTEGQAVTFQGSAEDPDGDDMSYHWDFGDGISATGLSPADHVYTESGSYTVVFTVTDARGAVDPTPDSRKVMVEGGGGTEEATFSAVQARIFNASCAFSGCHGGGSASAGLNLDPGSAYGNIVNVASSEQPSLKRIQPNDPASSYLYLKVTGDPSITGSRMPRGAAALAEELIDLLRDWIERGAPND